MVKHFEIAEAHVAAAATAVNFAIYRSVIADRRAPARWLLKLLYVRVAPTLLALAHSLLVV
jgi:hypothetical protein